jgi:hypothetical protein
MSFSLCIPNNSNAWCRVFISYNNHSPGFKPMEQVLQASRPSLHFLTILQTSLDLARDRSASCQFLSNVSKTPYRAENRDMYLTLFNFTPPWYVCPKYFGFVPFGLMSSWTPCEVRRLGSRSWKLNGVNITEEDEVCISVFGISPECGTWCIPRLKKTTLEILIRTHLYIISKELTDHPAQYLHH